ncbi:probable protein S-acyltransferase 22 [Amborella trichopoda]|uniref:S-acyltransferase n=1 Tax=Amborella trichopoda TaxID=13333 RepID=W1P9D1_AMBTC|nr:probable protein S-acyltransferase 22 [Amborella trichopoda]ERN06512.1 hypothetical protein AMTR_s00058p00078640 [Amborella trichopoda]|eukprot:XP_006844837.1 probable protein S-acyltransferase 22 [Amborella trichopoda]
MRKHGWQLPYHPLQVVAVAVFIALAFAFYVFFVPFVGKKVFQFVVIGVYTPLVASVFALYIWCAATDPGDPGVFKSKKYQHISNDKKHSHLKGSESVGATTSPLNDVSVASVGEKGLAEGMDVAPMEGESAGKVEPKRICTIIPMILVGCCPFACLQNLLGSHDQSSEAQTSEDGMFYCSLCEVEVYKYSKHCRVCDKCVDGFDHHCRWLNNCIGRKNYKRFFTLMVSALLLLILQWSIGILVLICCFLERKRFLVEIISKLGSSFSLVPFVVVVASCTLLAMIATLPLVQLFFFHVLLIKKGISTYDYIVALREQEQQCVEPGQSPQMSPAASSLTGMSSASSFGNFHSGAWCTPPRLFVEDQFDVIPSDAGLPMTSSRKKGMMVTEEPFTKKRNPAPVKISPWTLARLDAEQVSKAAAQARKRSKILQPVARRDALETDSSLGSSSGRMAFRVDNNNKKRPNKKANSRLPLDHQLVMKAPSKSDYSGHSNDGETSNSLAPLQMEARSAFRTSRAMSSAATGAVVASSPESSLDSPDLHPFRVSSSGADDTTQGGLSGAAAAASQGGSIRFSRSTSDGYEASGGEDSDRVVPPRVHQRSSNWSSLLFGSSSVGYGDGSMMDAALQMQKHNRVGRSRPTSSSGLGNGTKGLDEQL